MTTVRHTREHEEAIKRGLAPAIGFGLGDAVALVAQPIARVVDAVAKTDLQNCGGCAERKARWNAALHL